MGGLEQGVKPRRRALIILSSVALSIVLFAAALLVVRGIPGRGTELRSLPRTLLSTMMAVANQNKVVQSNAGDISDIIFLHHSTGNNLIEQGGLRELFSQAGYDFWDQSYNDQGLRDPQGKLTGYAYPVPGDNTDPDGLARIFHQRAYHLPVNVLSGLLQHDVIIIKSCFAPANQITSDQQVEIFKSYYLEIRDSMAQYPEKLFIILTTPPLNPVETNSQQARRARALAEWLKSPAFLNGQSNIVVYDLFAQLAENDPASPEYNMLRKEYRDGGDSHPNRAANQEIAPVIANSIINAIQTYRSSIQDH
jgi:hypothetical protein